VNGPPSDLHIKKRAASCERLTAPFSKQESRNDFEASRPSLVNLATFRPFAQGHFPEFIPPEIPPAPLPDGYGYGAGRAVRGGSTPSSFSWAKMDWRIPEQSSVERASVHNDCNFTSASYECLRESEKDELKQRSIGKSKFSKEEVKKFEEDAQGDVNRRIDAEVSIAQRYRDRDRLFSFIKDAYPEESIRLRNCGEHLVIRRRRYCGRFEGWSLLQGCGQRICPFCGRARANSKFKSYWPKFWSYARRHPHETPCAMVLTYKDNSEDWVDLRYKEKLIRTKAALGKLLRRQEFRAHISAGDWSIENSKNSSGNDHVHVHMVVFRRGFWPNENIASLWSEVTDGCGGFSFIKRKDDLRSTLKESLKYSLKPSAVRDWTQDDALQFMEIKGMKLSTRFGGLSGNGKNGFKMTQEELDLFDELEGSEDEIDSVCRSCGREDEWVLDTLCVGRSDVGKELRSRSGDWAVLNIIRSREARAP